MKETRRIHGKNTRSGAPGRVKRWLIGAEGWLSARSWRYLAGPLVAVLCVLALDVSYARTREGSEGERARRVSRFFR